jgi:hypothetical protein
MKFQVLTNNNAVPSMRYFVSMLQCQVFLGEATSIGKLLDNKRNEIIYTNITRTYHMLLMLVHFVAL